MAGRSDVAEACLGDDTIAAMLEGGLTDDAARVARTHIAGCVTCRRLVSAAIDANTVPGIGPATMPPAVATRHGVAAGDVIAGRYRIERLLGEGGMGRVYAGRQIGLARSVAVKILRPELASDGLALARFHREALMVASLISEQVVRVHDLGALDTGEPYLVMELLEGDDLARVLLRGAVPLEHAIAWVLSACEALAEAHALGIVHRDIKPSNLFLTRFGRIKVLDFGLAKLAAPLSRTMSMTADGVMLGSPRYMAPEQIVAARDVDHRADIWSLGATLYHLVTGGPPFAEAPVPAVFSHILAGNLPRLDALPPPIAAVIRRALARDPAARFGSVVEFAAALRPPAPQVSAPAAVSWPGRILPGVIAGAVVGLVVVSIGRWSARRAAAPTPTPGTAIPAEGSGAGSGPPSPAPVGVAVTAPPVDAGTAPPVLSLAPAPTADHPAWLEPRAIGSDDEGVALGLYADCFNEADHRVRDSWASYIAWVDPARGPTGKEDRIDGISWMEDYYVGLCLKNLAAARPAVPAPVARPTAAYVGAFAALLPVMTEVKQYYDHKDYKDDGFAGARALNGKLVTAYAGWDRASVALRAAWETQHRAIRGSELDAIAKDKGRASERFVAAQVIIAAEQLVEIATSAAPRTLDPAITAYQAAFGEMDRFYGPGLTASTDTDRYVFKQAADELLIQTKEIHRAHKADKPLPEDGDGSVAKLLVMYDRLIAESNQITWK